MAQAPPGCHLDGPAHARDVRCRDDHCNPEEDDKASVIILTTYDSDEDVYRGMRAGAKAYLLKDAHREELLNCIRAVYAGKTFISPGVASKLASRLREDELTPGAGNPYLVPKA